MSSPSKIPNQKNTPRVPISDSIKGMKATGQVAGSATVQDMQKIKSAPQFNKQTSQKNSQQKSQTALVSEPQSRVSAKQVPGIESTSPIPFGMDTEENSSPVNAEKSAAYKKQGRWTQQEKQLFIDALRLYGKDWKKVERHIKTRSGSQIRSHAQKFFQNDERSKGMDIDEYVLHLQTLVNNGDEMNDKASVTHSGMVTPTDGGAVSVSQFQHAIIIQDGQSINEKIQKDAEKLKPQQPLQLMSQQRAVEDQSPTSGHSPFASTTFNIGQNQKMFRFPALSGATGSNFGNQAGQRKILSNLSNQKLMKQKTKITVEELFDSEELCMRQLSQLELDFRQIWSQGLHSPPQTCDPNLMKHLVDELQTITQGKVEVVAIDSIEDSRQPFQKVFDDKILEENEAVLILSIFEKPYTSQRARIRKVVNKEIFKEVYLKEGTLLTMKKPRDFRFEIPKIAGKISDQLGKKIVMFFVVKQQQSQKPASPLKIGQTPSFGGINLTHFNIGPQSAFGMPDREQLGPDQKPHQQFMPQQFLQQQILNNTSTNNNNSTFLNLPKQVPGRDRAYSSQSGFLVPTISQQDQEHRTTSLLVSKLNDLLQKQKKQKFQQQNATSQKTNIIQQLLKTSNQSSRGSPNVGSRSLPPQIINANVGENSGGNQKEQNYKALSQNLNTLIKSIHKKQQQTSKQAAPSFPQTRGLSEVSKQSKPREPEVTGFRNIKNNESKSVQPILQQEQEIDFSDEIEKLEIKKHSLYLNFINDLSSQTLFINPQNTGAKSEIEQFSENYWNLFKDIQGKLLQMYNQEMTFYINESKDTQTKTIRDKINPRIVQNMVEVLNLQILFKALTNLFQHFRDGQGSQNTAGPEVSNTLKFRDMSPIDIRIFKQLIPSTYHESLAGQLRDINMSDSEPNAVDSPEQQSIQQQAAKSVNPQDFLLPVQQSVDEDMAPVNQISTSQQTFQQIAHSLSPNPEKLLAERIQLDLNKIKMKDLELPGSEQQVESQMVGEKRKRQPSSQNDCDEDQISESNFKVQRVEDQVALNVSSPDSKDMGVRIGGYRQLAYSDSHKELLVTMGRLSAEDLQALTTRQQNTTDPDLAGQLKLIVQKSLSKMQCNDIKQQDDQEAENVIYSKRKEERDPNKGENQADIPAQMPQQQPPRETGSQKRESPSK